MMRNGVMPRLLVTWAAVALMACASDTASRSEAPAAPANAAAVERVDTDQDGSSPGSHGGAAEDTGYQIEVMQLTAQPAMVQSGRVPPAELEAALTAAIPALVGYAMANRLQIAGPPFVRYLSRSADMIEYQAGLPVLRTGPGTDTIEPLALPAGPAATTMHTGPYRELPAAHEALQAWRVGHGRVASGPGWEVFLTNPIAEPDPRTWRTKVFLPLEPEESNP